MARIYFRASFADQPERNTFPAALAGRPKNFMKGCVSAGFSFDNLERLAG
jgi:hypothetical protein